MIIVNTTFVAETPLVSELLKWIRESYEASALHLGALPQHTLLTKVLTEAAPGAETYALHLWWEDMDTARRWDEKVGAALRSKLTARWGERAMAFHTYLEVTE